METITRKTMLYKTGVEYGDYTVNHVLGCSHGCQYPCYALFPYEHPEISAMSFEIIKMLNDAGIKCTVLTKGLLPAKLAALSAENEYGISLVSLEENFREEYEPNTAPYDERIRALEFLKNKGCQTWVSMEPYPTPNIVKQDLWWILNEIFWIDKLVFGRWNYNKLVSQYKGHKEFYSECVDSVKDFCKHYEIQYVIKKGTVIKNGQN